ncbi:beta-eliminating lyase-related protein [Streptomyces sp. NBC_01498]|uniref:threonine aldolase family protein n=1 Tax=Streptomyces sp. NBC_01498 TaxID=2975870 RepID=UPI002E7BAC59|nr:beta-eliminating lyase-related protein [Streptomyces sp. NBC_01498]WTL25405.1 beta-eliminating lyase-related protein [Streptomyces sp. NBC_01498]
MEDTKEQEERHRRLTALRAADRTLWRSRADRPVGEALAALAADASSVHDPDDWADTYGNGVVAELESRVASLLGFPAAAFFPTGTMAQQVALRCWAGRTGNATVALHPLAHPEVHEGGALSAVSGLRTIHPTSAPRLPTAEEIHATDEPFGTLMLELPLRDAGFVLPSWDELVAVVAAARERDAVVHFDGARLWECVTHFGRPLEEIAGLADSVYVSFYKSLGGLSGAMLAGPSAMVGEARAWRHRYGGQVFQQYPAAVSALLGLERELPRLPSYVAHARVVADALAEGFAEAGTGAGAGDGGGTGSGPVAPWFRVHPRRPHTHQFRVWLPYDAEVLSKAAVRQAEETGVALFRRWFDAGSRPPGMAVTEVTVGSEGLEWTADDVRRAVREFMARVRAADGPTDAATPEGPADRDASGPGDRGVE